MKNYLLKLSLACLSLLVTDTMAMQDFKSKVSFTSYEAFIIFTWGVKNVKEKILWSLNIPRPYQLLAAAGSGNITEIERLISLGVSVDAEEPYDFFKWFLGGDFGTPLNWAFNCSQDVAAITLLRLGARIDKTNQKPLSKKFLQLYIIEILQGACPEMQKSADDMGQIIGAYLGGDKKY